MSQPDDDTDEYIEEEFLVFADFQTKLATDVLADPEVKIKVIGMEDQNPIMQVNDKMFQGTFAHSIGTHVFFEEDPSPPPRLHLYEPEPEVVYKLHTTTDKLLLMNRMFVEQKNVERKAEHNDTDTDGDAPIPITKSYAMALNQFLQPGEAPPRTLDDGSDRFYKKYRTDGDRYEPANDDMDIE